MVFSVLPDEAAPDAAPWGALAAPLDPDEQQALRVRAKALADYARFPEERSGPPLPMAAGLTFL